VRDAVAIDSMDIPGVRILGIVLGLALLVGAIRYFFGKR
jgi:hypothetical protein